MAAITRLGSSGYGTRRTGSFANRSPQSISAGLPEETDSALAVSVLLAGGGLRRKASLIEDAKRRRRGPC